MSFLQRHHKAVEDFGDADLPSLRQALIQVADPRSPRGIRYMFTELLLICVAAVISGAKSLTMIAEWAGEAHHRKVITQWKTTPSVPTLHRVMAGIDPVALDEAVNGWICQRTAAAAPAASSTADDGTDSTDDSDRDGHRSADRSEPPGFSAVAVAGKEVRGAKHGGGSKTFLMAALDHRTGTVLGQEAVEAKTNEIPHLPVLLDRLGPMQDRVITADALHTLPQQAQAITDRGGHYLFTVKTNAKALHQKISSIGWAGRRPQHRAREKAHGRTSTWQTTVATAPARLGFPQAAQIIQIQRGRADHANPDQATGEIVYAVTSLTTQQASPAQLASLLRGHWGIENRLHWVRDTAYDEDTSQIRTGKAAHVMATIRNLAISVHRLAGHTNITATLRHYGRDPQLAADLTGL